MSDNYESIPRVKSTEAIDKALEHLFATIAKEAPSCVATSAKGVQFARIGKLQSDSGYYVFNGNLYRGTPKALKEQTKLEKEIAELQAKLAALQK